jgi:membrane protease subunit HflC
MAANYTANGEYEASLIRYDVVKKVNIIISNAEAEAAKAGSRGRGEYMRMLAAAYDTADKQDF